MPHTKSIILGLCVLLCLPIMARAADTSNQESVSKLYGELAHEDPKVRNNARLALMHITKADLPALKAAAASQPMQPAQADVIKEIVMQVHVRGTIDFSKPGVLFIGILTPESYGYEAQPSKDGCIVTECFMGFSAYPYLNMGDIIVAAGASAPDKIIRSTDDLRKFLATQQPGNLIFLRIQRGESISIISFKLDSNPLIKKNTSEENPGVTTTNKLLPMIRNAEKYFDSEFASLLPPDFKSGKARNGTQEMRLEGH